MLNREKFGTRTMQAEINPEIVQQAQRQRKYELPKPLPEQISRGIEPTPAGRNLAAALCVCEGSLRAIRQTQGWRSADERKRINQAEASALERWAKANGHWIPEAEFNQKWEADGRRGESEHQVYFNDQSQTWVKRNTLNFHYGSISAYLERLATQAFLFPELTPHFKGLTTYQGEVMPIIEQPHAVGTGASDEFICSELIRVGFIEVLETGKGMSKAHGLAMEAGLNPPPLGQPKRVGFYNPDVGIWLEDVHSENAVKSPKGELQVFDPVTYLVDKIPIQKVGGGPRLILSALNLVLPPEKSGIFPESG